jgi:hypothetical protein
LLPHVTGLFRTILILPDIVVRILYAQPATTVSSGSSPCENSTRYKRTLNFEACGHAQSEKTQKLVLRSALRPNHFWRLTVKSLFSGENVGRPLPIALESRGVSLCSLGFQYPKFA